MSEESRDDIAHDKTSRRGFLGRLATTSLAVAGASVIAEHPALGQLMEDPGAEVDLAAPWNMAWVERIKAARYRMAFDCADTQNGLALAHAALYMADYSQVSSARDSDFGLVVVVRHEGIPLILNDAFWAKYGLGARLQVKDENGAPVKRNPWAGTQAAAASRSATRPDPTDEITTVADLIARGVVVLGCDRALRWVASSVAQTGGATAAQAEADTRAAVLPGVIMMPSGIFALGRAQDAGCGYMRST